MNKIIRREIVENPRKKKDDVGGRTVYFGSKSAFPVLKM
jgi:hypothetical protein